MRPRETQSYLKNDARSDRGIALLAGADADGFFDRRDENLAVANPAGTRGVHDGFHRPFDHGILADHLDLHFRQEIHDVFGAAV
jgi:hypothetical protein